MKGVFQLHKSACAYCGRIKEYKYKSLIKKYCSHKCSNRANPRTGLKVKIKCNFCKEDFELLASAKRSREKGGRVIKYCSKRCEGLDRRKRETIMCEWCDKPFETTRNKFCSSTCFGLYQKETGIQKKDGYWIENGYKVLYLSDNRSIKEHIKIMEDHIGRKLYPNEVVHHKNEIKTDNRIENLQIMTRSEHSRHHRLKELSEGKRLFGK